MKKKNLKFRFDLLIKDIPNTSWVSYQFNGNIITMGLICGGKNNEIS